MYTEMPAPKLTGKPIFIVVSVIVFGVIVVVLISMIVVGDRRRDTSTESLTKPLPESSALTLGLKSAKPSGTVQPFTSSPTPVTLPTLHPLEFRRERLAESYLFKVQTEESHLNHIQTKITKTKGGYALWTVHDYFGRYSFSIGSLGPSVQSWISENYGDLKASQITRVGVKNAQGYGGSVWYEVK